ncbi:MAG: hypothetical protein J5685_00630 [Clostridiales bacterium]|nr:hypothetical protein [Clostridiales bacterium]
MDYQNCWQILGIERTNDIKAIKKAYSELAKRYNPEDDPEMFGKVHNAYKHALLIARSPDFSYEQTKVRTSSDKEINDQAEEEDTEDKADPYDFTDIDAGRIHTDPLMLAKERLVYFRQNNKADSYPVLSSMKETESRRLARELLYRYITLASVSNDTDYLLLYFDEPITQMFGHDPRFRKWLAASLSGFNGESDDPLIRSYIDELANAPSLMKWNSNLENKVRDKMREMPYKLIIPLIGIILLIVIVIIIKAFFGQAF